MTITTKYSPDQLVWFLYQNKVISGEIQYVYTKGYPNNSPDIWYELKNRSGNFNENDLFPSKEALLQSL